MYKKFSHVYGSTEKLSGLISRKHVFLEYIPQCDTKNP